MICSKCNKSVKECKCIPDWFKKEVKSKVEFYKKVEGKSLAFGDKHLNLYKQFIKWWGNNYSGSSLSSYAEYLIEERFNPWLFDHCFKDVI